MENSLNKTKSENRVILHCDVNNFYASVECCLNPELKNKPIAVSGNPKTRTGIILAKNEIAKSFGVKTGDTIYEAKIKCPNIICLPPHHKLYEQISQKIIKIYYNYTDVVESFGIDECWLDVTGSLKLFGSGKRIADLIRKQVLKEIGVTISVGVSFTKLFAKLGSDLKKPFATTVISKENFKEIVYPLPANSVIGIGKRINRKLEKINVLTLGDFVKIPDAELKAKLGKNGVVLKQKLLGNDFEEVVDNSKKPEVKSVGNGTTTITDIIRREEVFGLVQFLSNKISKRLSDKNLYGKTIHVTIKTADFQNFGKSETILKPLFLQEEISLEAMKIIDSFWDYTTLIRSIRISVRNLKDISSPTQISMFEVEKDKSKKIMIAVDEIRDKFGESAIQQGSVVASKFINKAEE